LGHPGQGQTSTEIRHEGQHTSSKATSGPEGAGASGGSGLTNPDDSNKEFRSLQSDDHPKGPISEYNATKSGAEDREPESAEFVAREAGKAGEYTK